METRAYVFLWRLACFIGKPIGGLRPRRLYHFLAKRAFSHPQYQWYRNCWGDQLYLSPYYLIDRSIIAFGTYDADLHKFIEAKVQSGMVCLDIGANIGEVSLHLARRVHPEGRVIAFEPDPAIFNRLQINVDRSDFRNNITLEEMALSDTSGICGFSIVDPCHENQGMGHLDLSRTDDVAKVRSMSLDAYAERNTLERLDFIKIDIQGSEPLFLRGAQKTIKRFKPDILMEVSPTDLKRFGSSSRELVRQIEDIGYSVFQIASGKPDRRISHSSLSASADFSNVYCTTERPQTVLP